MIRIQPSRIILIGVVLMVMGIVFPLLMVLQLVESTFFLNFVSFIASTSGLFLGLVGIAWYSRLRKK